jgi:hypothetical protein
MAPDLLIFLTVAIFVVAILYGSVGHGGASGYIALMALCGLAPALLKPTALSLNIVVSATVAILFIRSGHFAWRLFWPFALTSIPASFIGGYLTLPPAIYRPLLGVALLFAALRLVLKVRDDDRPTTALPLPLALLIGALFGLLSGLTGIGGGIFLSPLLLLGGWGKTREVAGVAALFILVNSLAGLLGHSGTLAQIPSFTPLLAVAAFAGGLLGATLGCRLLPTRLLIHALSLVLLLAGSKLILL